jgi:N4-gp56 family major capsid protein
MPNTMTSAVASGGSKSGIILSGAVREVYSREIMFQAQPLLITAQFADRKTELSREKGDTIRFTKYNDLIGGARLSEVEPIVTTHLSASQVAIQVTEYGYAVSESERLIRTAWDDVVARATALLGQHYGRTVDSLVQDEFIAAGSLQTILPAGVANRPAIAAANTLSVKMIKDAAEILAVNKASKINGSYVALVHPHSARVLRDDPAWIEAHKYTNPAVNNIFMGEIGMMEGVRFVETTFLPIITQTTGVVTRDGNATGQTEALVNNNVDVYQTLFMGANAVGWATALPVEFRDGGVIDFGRTRQLAWYSIMGAGQIRPENTVLAEHS